MVEVIPLKVSSGIMKNYSYVIHAVDSDEAVIVDPAWELKSYLEVIKQKQLVPVALLITHTHFDHINLVQTFSNRFELPFCV